MSRFYVIITLLILFFPLLSPCAENNVQDKKRLEEEFTLANHDTSRIKILFQLGNLFVDGPSDSLLLYYNKSLDLIESFFSGHNETWLKRKVELNNIYEEFHFRALIEIGIEKFYQGKFNESLGFYFRALDVANSRNDQGMQSEVYGAIGIVYKNQGDFGKALEYYESALETAIVSGDTSWIAACYSNTGNIHRRLTNYEKAQEYYLAALKVFEESGNKRRIAITLINIGNLYEDQKDYTKALDYYRKAIELSEETGDPKSISECLANIGNIYSQNGDNNKAREYYEKAMQLNKELGYERFLDISYQNIGYTYEVDKQYDKALGYYQKALALALKNDNKITISAVHGNIANIFLQKQDYKNALSHAEECLKYSLEVNDPRAKKDAFLYMSWAWEGIGNYPKALQYFREYSAVKDTIFDADKYKTIKDLEIKYETEKKENQLTLLGEQNRVQQLTLEKRKRLIWGTVLFFLLLFVIVYLFLRQKQIKEKHKGLVLEQKLLRTQMSPHFVFNSLIAIQNYIYSNKPLIAGDYLARFADLIRTTLDGSRNEFIPLDKEIRMMNTYLELQKLRFKNAFEYTLTVDEKLDVENINIPPMFAQPFVENAIEHGLRHLSGSGWLDVVYSQKRPCCISVTVQDNGVGRQQSRQIEKKEEHQSQAINITRERLDVLSKHFKQHFHFQITDICNEAQKSCGVKVTIDIPTQ